VVIGLLKIGVRDRSSGDADGGLQASDRLPGSR
jgi:hypothetical protein